MALINCSECGKQVSDKASSCPNCGNPINKTPTVSQPNSTANSKEDVMHCPKCNSSQLSSNKKGFSGGKALTGAVLTGGIGLLAGTIGSSKVMITCLKCGYKFKAGEYEVMKTICEQDRKRNLKIEEDIVSGKSSILGGAIIFLLISAFLGAFSYAFFTRTWYFLCLIFGIGAIYCLYVFIVGVKEEIARIKKIKQEMNKS